MKRVGIVAAAAIFALPMAARAQVEVTVAGDQLALLEDSDPIEARNKKLVWDFWREVFQTGDMSKLDQYMHPNYIQHNPLVATGREPFRQFFGGRGGPPRPVQPAVNNLVTIAADGDIVVMAFRREMPDPRNPGETYTTTWFDMFRIIDGQIGEHWDYGTISAPTAGRGGGAAPGTGS
jgi:predicted SnoaL-like aldol condensation-catalyzing enzyme